MPEATSPPVFWAFHRGRRITVPGLFLLVHRNLLDVDVVKYTDVTWASGSVDIQRHTSGDGKRPAAPLRCLTSRDPAITAAMLPLKAPVYRSSVLSCLDSL